MLIDDVKQIYTSIYLYFLIISPAIAKLLISTTIRADFI